MLRGEKGKASSHVYPFLLQRAYKKIISLVKLTSQEMFSGIDLNLNPLDDDDKMREIKALDLSLDDACRRIIEMAGNQCSAQQMQVSAQKKILCF